MKAHDDDEVAEFEILQERKQLLSYNEYLLHCINVFFIHYKIIGVLVEFINYILSCHYTAHGNKPKCFATGC